MNYTPTDAQIRNGLAMLKSNSDVFVNYQNKRKAFRLLEELLLGNIIDSKKTLIVSDSQEDTLEILKFLGLNKVSNLALELNDNQSISENEVHKIRSMAKFPSKKLAAHASKKSRDQFEIKYNSLKRKYRYLHSKNANSKSIYDQLQNEFIADENVHLFSQSIDSNIPHLDRIVSLYQSNFSILDASDPFSFEFYNKIAGENQVLSHAKKMFNQVVELYQSFLRTKKDLISDYKSKADKEFLLLDNASDTLEEFYINNKDRIKKNESVKTSGLINKFMKADKIDFDAIHEASKILSEKLGIKISEFSTDNIEKLLSNWNLIRSSYSKSKTQEAEAFVNQLSCRANGAEELSSLNQRLEELIEEINQSGFFKTTLTNNAWNLNGQITTLQKVLTTIRNGNVLIDNVMYINWKILVNELDANQKLLISEMFHLPREQWLDLIDQAKTKFEQKEINPYRLPVNNNDFIELEENQRNLVQVLLTDSQDSWVSNRSEALDRFKRKNKEVFNAFFKKKNKPDINWHQLFNVENGFVSDFFPVCIIKSKDLHNNWSQHFDVVIGLDTEVASFENQIKAGQQIFHINTEDIPDDCASTYYTLSGVLSNHINTVSNIEDKLETTKDLTNQIRAFKPNVQVYQLKETVVLSLLSSTKNESIKNELSDINMKELLRIDGEEDLIEEALVYTVPNKFLLIENNLISSYHIEDWQYQWEIINKLRHHGFEILNVWEYDIIKNKTATFKTHGNTIRNSVQKAKSTLTSSI